MQSDGAGDTGGRNAEAESRTGLGPAQHRSSPKAPIRHGAVDVQSVAAELLANGYSEHQVFSGTGFNAEILHQVRPVAEFDQIAAFFERAADLTGNGMFGFQEGQKRELRRAGLISYVGLSSPTVRDFIRNVARYRRVFSDALELDASALDSSGIMRWYYNLPLSVSRRQYVEFAASGLIEALRKATNRRLFPVQVTFRHPRNADIAAFEKFFGCGVTFGAEEHSIQFRQSDLSRPLHTADDHLYSVLRELCEEALKKQSRRAPVLIVEVERALTTRLPTGEATQTHVAHDLGMSSRTLSRRLMNENTTFFQVLDDLRKSLAISYLKDGGLSLAETSYLLGYSGLSSFNEAFKRWTGQTPGQFRNT